MGGWQGDSTAEHKKQHPTDERSEPEPRRLPLVSQHICNEQICRTGGDEWQNQVGRNWGHGSAQPGWEHNAHGDMDTRKKHLETYWCCWCWPATKLLRSLSHLVCLPLTLLPDLWSFSLDYWWVDYWPVGMISRIFSCRDLVPSVFWSAIHSWERVVFNFLFWFCLCCGLSHTRPHPTPPQYECGRAEGCSLLNRIVFLLNRKVWSPLLKTSGKTEELKVFGAEVWWAGLQGGVLWG